LTFSPSANRLNDTPATASQDRTLTNYGAKGDITINAGPHSVKFGGTVQATPLHEQFTFGITDPSDPAFADEDGNFNPALRPYDLTSGGSLLTYDQSFTIKQQAAYIQDDIRVGTVTFKAGVRLDHYDGLTSKTLVQPRVGASYAVPVIGTVVRASYGRSLETPYNENLLLGAGYGERYLRLCCAGCAESGRVRYPKGFGRWVVVDGYFTKRTDNGYDWRAVQHADRVPGRVGALDDRRIHGQINLVEHRIRAFIVMAHTSAIYCLPASGHPARAARRRLRIDHDQNSARQRTSVRLRQAVRCKAALSWRATQAGGWIGAGLRPR
jgi:hypothetical protein